MKSRAAILNRLLSREQVHGLSRDHAELVAAHAKHRIGVLADPSQSVGDTNEQVAAGGMAEGVVVGLEAVQVKHAAERLAPVVAQLRQSGRERTPVAEAGERIGGSDLLLDGRLKPQFDIGGDSHRQVLDDLTVILGPHPGLLVDHAQCADAGAVRREGRAEVRTDAHAAERRSVLGQNPVLPGVFHTELRTVRAYATARSTACAGSSRTLAIATGLLSAPGA